MLSPAQQVNNFHICCLQNRSMTINSVVTRFLVYDTPHGYMDCTYHARELLVSIREVHSFHHGALEMLSQPKIGNLVVFQRALRRNTKANVKPSGKGDKGFSRSFWSFKTLKTAANFHGFKVSYLTCFHSDSTASLFFTFGGISV